MKVGNQKVSLKAERWAVPGKEQTLDDLISLFASRGVVILQVDRDKNRLLVGREEEIV